jgi:hypothetical protein
VQEQQERNTKGTIHAERVGEKRIVQVSATEQKLTINREAKKLDSQKHNRSFETQPEGISIQLSHASTVGKNSTQQAAKTAKNKQPTKVLWAVHP